MSMNSIDSSPKRAATHPQSLGDMVKGYTAFEDDLEALGDAMQTVPQYTQVRCTTSRWPLCDGYCILDITRNVWLAPASPTNGLPSGINSL